MASRPDIRPPFSVVPCTYQEPGHKLWTIIDADEKPVATTHDFELALFIVQAMTETGLW